jgi:crotonobetainyl-CoA:carnitine CoA-transferase CaiB-like acyl-CoA transferase
MFSTITVTPSACCSGSLKNARHGVGRATGRIGNDDADRLVGERGRRQNGPVRAADGDVLVVPITARNFAALCQVTGLPELKGDPRVASLPARNANWAAMMAVVERWTRERSVAECDVALEAAGVPCSAYGDPGDALADPHLIGRGLFGRVSDAAGAFTGVNPPGRMSGTRAELRERVPAVGADTGAALKDWLVLTSVELARLRANGAFGAAPH